MVLCEFGVTNKSRAEDLFKRMLDFGFEETEQYVHKSKSNPLVKEA